MAFSDRRFANLGNPESIWAVGSIHGDSARLTALHAILDEAVQPGDRVVYLGNMLGYGANAVDALDELVAFRSAKLAEGMEPSHFIYLRGMQEEMWQKLLQLQFAHKPEDVLKWMIEHGMEATVKAYGGNIEHGLAAARTGAIHLNRWTAGLRGEMHLHEGHEGLISTLRRAAFTENGNLLLVSAGIDPDIPINDQGDSLWWGHPGFDEIESPLDGVSRIVRGFDPDNSGMAVGVVTTTLDGGCGRGGSLIAARLSARGELNDTVEV